MTKWCSSNEALSHKYVYDTTGEYHRTSNGSFSFEGDKLYSYRTQIASIDRKKKRIIMMQSYWSQTTTHHLYLLERALPDDYIKVYSDCFVWKDLYKTFLKEIQNYYKQKKHKRKNNILSIKKDRIRLNILKDNLECINKYDYFEKHHKDLYNFIEKNIRYESDRLDTIQKKRQKAIEGYLARVKMAALHLENFLNSEDCRKSVELFIKQQNIPNNNLINLVKLQQSLQKYLKAYLYDNRHILKDTNISLYSNELYYVLKDFIRERLFNFPKKEQYQFYDIVYFDHDNLILMTTRSITLQTDKDFLKSIIKMIKIYLTGKHFELLIGKHVGPYCIRSANADQICIGCHSFHYNNIKMLYDELEQYE